MPGQVAAIHRGNIFRIEWPQVLRVVPVKEMPAKPLKLPHRRECQRQSVDCFLQPGPAKVTRADGGEKIKPHIGWRGPVCDDRLWIFLKVIRWQHAVGRCDKSLEVSPRPTGDKPERRCVRCRDCHLAGIKRRQADPIGDKRRSDPEKKKRYGDRPCRGCKESCAKGDGSSQDDTTRHLPGEAEDI